MFDQTSGYLVTQSNWCIKLATTDSMDGKRLNMRRRTWLAEHSLEREGESQGREVSGETVQRRSSQRWAEQRGNHGAFKENERLQNEKRPHFYVCELTGLISLKYKYIFFTTHLQIGYHNHKLTVILFNCIQSLKMLKKKNILSISLRWS